MRAVVILLCVVAAGIVAFFVVGRPAVSSTQPVAGPAVNPIARGKYLVTITGCNDCHSPHDQRGEIIKGLELSGHPEKAPLPEWEPEMLKKNILATFAPTMTAFAGPFGTSVAPNLTPDLETGLVVSVEGLIASWRTGAHWKYGRPILPPMPAADFKEMTEEDVRAIFAYLKSIPAVRNKPPESLPAPPPPTGAGGSGK